MKHSFQTILFAFIYFFAAFQTNAQTIQSVAFNPTAPTSCTTTAITVVAEKPCGNTVVNPTQSSVVGFTVTVIVDMSQGAICTPIISYTTQTANFVNLPAGSYTVNVQVKVNGTVTDNQNYPMTVTSCCTANPAFTASATSLCPNGTVAYTATATNMNSYIWKVNGAVVGNASTLSYTHTTVGTYAVKLITTTAMCTDSSTQTITVGAMPTLSASLNNPESCPNAHNGLVGLSVSGGYGSYSYLWSTGATTQNLTQASAGTYTATATGAPGCTASNSFTVGTGIPVVASFTSNIPNGICVGSSGLFTNTSTNATSRVWYYDTNNIGTANTAAQNFGAVGTHTIYLIAINGVCRDTADFVVNVGSMPSLTGTPTNATCTAASDGSVQLVVNQGTAPFSYNWSNGASINPNTGLASGNYTVTITDQLGCTATNSFQVGASSFGASFTSDVTGTVCSGATAHFTNTSVGATSQTWTLNGTPFSTSTSASLVLNNAGAQTILLTTNNGSCTDTHQLVINVNATPVAAIDGSSSDVCLNTTNAFGSISTDATNVLWALDGNHFSTNTNVNITFSTVGSNTVELIAFNGNCTDTADIIVTVNALPSIAGTVNDNHCIGGSDGAVNTIATGASPFSYLWNNGGTSNALNNIPQGNYSLTVTDANGCSSTETYQVITLSSGVNAAFTSQSNDLNLMVNNTSSGNNPTYIWDFGDGSATSSLSSPAHSYATTGTYNVCLNITDNFGCSDNFCETVVISVMGVNSMAASGINLYPNPAHEEVFIELPSSLQGTVQYQIFDAQGRIIAENNTLNTSILNINTSKFQSGMYIVLLNINGQIWMGKFLVSDF